jgi:hypothetical protein
MPNSEPDEIDWITVKASTVGSGRQQWPSEVRDLTPWVLDHLDDLGNELGMQLKVMGREVAVGALGRTSLRATALDDR